MNRISSRFSTALALGAAAAVMSVCGVAAAADDPLANYYVNTVHETRADGSQNWFHFNADHSFVGKGSNGRDMSGTYDFDPATGASCLQIAGRAPGGPPACSNMPANAKVGDAWDRKGPTGGTEHFVLEAGRP
jgi:hypothetical protein